jgi:two-component system, LytTR family, sensor kinase
MTTRRFLWLAAAFWFLFGLVAGVQVWISMITHGHSIPLLLGFHLAVWLVWIAPTALIFWLARRLPVAPPRPLVLMAHFLIATVIGLLHTLYSLRLMLWLKPYDQMTATAAELKIVDILLAQLPLSWTFYLMVLGAVLALDYAQRYRERAAVAAGLQRSLNDARLHALELQLQPHFLFNTLNAIAALVRVGRQDEAITMIAGLADLLRYSLDHAGRQRVSLHEEIEMLKRYLEIQQARFPDRMTFNVTVADGLQQALVPILILQPLAENAVRHGIAESNAAGSIEVRAERSGSRLKLSIRNRGKLPTTLRHGIGLNNTRERLRTLYGEAAHFTLTQAGDAVVAVIDLPLALLP